MPLRRALVPLLALQALWAHPAAAQLSEIRGVVQDSASRAPIPAAVVMLLDAGGSTLVRVLTTDRGLYRLPRPQEAAQLRVVRLGFSPATLPLTRATPRPEGGFTLDVHLAPFARALQQVQVGAARGCTDRPDRGNALAWLDAARAGLLATVVAREKDPPHLTVLRFERLLDTDGIETVSQVVRVDSSAGASASFAATRSAADFLATGFRSGTAGDFTYFSPDAEVLLDERFQNGYCFGLAPAVASRPQQVGLQFSPASRREGRVDISGTVWIDSAAKALGEIDFRYVGVDAMAEGLGAGGVIAFRTLPNGVPFIDRWSMRLVGGVGADGGGGTVQRYTIREVGGELAQARWSDGRVWSAPLGTVHISAFGSGAPVAGALLRLQGTDYRATTNADGRATIGNLLPGPYTIMVDDPSLRPLRIAIPTERTFAAARGSTSLVRAELPMPVSVVQQQCHRSDLPKNNQSWLIARALASDGASIPGVRYQVFTSEDGRWKARTGIGTTGDDAVIALCDGLERNSTIEVVAWRDADPKTNTRADTVRVRRALQEPIASLRLEFASARSVAPAGGADPRPRSGPPVTLAGTIVDSVAGTPVADARITLVNSPFEGASDEQGRFVIGGVPRGRYTVEVGTAALDSVGVVWRRDIDLLGDGADVRFFAPRSTDGVVAQCGANSSGGVIIGRLLPPVRGNLAAIAGYRVIAEWSTDTSTLLATDSLGQSRLGGFVRVVPDANDGTFRVCGIPVGRAVAMRAEADVMVAGGTAPRAVTVAPARRIARLDLQLDTTLVPAPSLMGTVIADSTGAPIERAEVTLRDLGRSILTDRRGQFRFADLTPGPHLLSIRALGYAPEVNTIESVAGRAVEQRITLRRAAAQGLTAVNVTAATAGGVPEEFEERRRLGLGAYITREQIAAQPGRRLSDVMVQVRGFANVQGGSSGGAYVVGKRAPAHIQTDRFLSRQSLSDQGYYCPTATEQRQGIVNCACFAQVYVDDRLMNGGKPTEPFDVNTVLLDQIAGVEFYASPASTPARYSQLNAVCGVMLIWLRRD